MNRTSDIPLFVLATYLPTNRTCAQAAATVGSIFRFHPQAEVLLVDNDSPPGNVRRSVAFFLTATHASGFGARLHVSVVQSPSRGQLGAWLVAHALLTRAEAAAAARMSRRGH